MSGETDLGWKIPIGTTARWTTDGWGRIERRGVVVAHLPAGESLAELSYSVGVPVARNLVDKSSKDRYVVKVPKLSQRTRLPMKGKVELMAPMRCNFDANAEGVGDES